MTDWRTEIYACGTSKGIVQCEGHTYRGLGLHRVSNGSPDESGPPLWLLTHLGSGHVVCSIRGRYADAILIATEIAECCDWEFGGLYGYLNKDPELRERFEAIVARHAPMTARPGVPRDQAIADQIANLRV